MQLFRVLGTHFWKNIFREKKKRALMDYGFSVPHLLCPGTPGLGCFALRARLDSCENSLTLHGNGYLVGIFRLALGRDAPSGGAQEDRG